MWQTISRAARIAVPALGVFAIGACFQTQPPDGEVVPDGSYAGTVIAYPEESLGYGCGSPFASPLGYGYYGYSPYSLGLGYGDSCYSPYAYGYGYSPYGYGYGYSPYSLYGYPYAGLYGPGIISKGKRVIRYSPRANHRYGLRPWGQSYETIQGTPGVPGHLQSGTFLQPGMKALPTFRAPMLHPAPILRGRFTPPAPPRPPVHYAPRTPPPPPPPPRPAGSERRR